MKISRWIIMIYWPKMDHDGHLWQEEGWAQLRNDETDYYLTKAKAITARNKWVRKKYRYLTEIVELTGSVAGKR